MEIENKAEADRLKKLEERVLVLSEALLKTQALCMDLYKESASLPSKDVKKNGLGENEIDSREISLQQIITKIVSNEISPLAAKLDVISDNMAVVTQDTFKLNWKREQRFYPEPVLPGLILKNDHFANCHRLKEPPIREGVFNFRQVTGLPIYGVNQCTLPGVEFVANHLVANKNINHVVWVNLREEPVVYIADTPYSPREPSQLNTNIDYLLSIEGFELEMMENRMKLDVLHAAEENESKFPVYHQNDNMENEKQVIQITTSSVTTLRELYSNMIKKGFPIVYARIPIQDECAPEEKDVVELVSLIHEHYEDMATAFVFNCQMGRGRTTTGMVICTLMLWALQTHDRCLATSLSSTMFHSSGGGRVSRHPSKPGLNFNDLHSKSADLYMNGSWDVITELCDTLPDGLRIKLVVDRAIDQCGVFQNLRETIYDCKLKADNPPIRPPNVPRMEKLNEHADDPDDTYSSAFWYRRGLHYLERYFYLILIGVYINLNASKEFKEPFDLWMRQRWNLKRMLKKMRLE